MSIDATSFVISPEAPAKPQANRYKQVVLKICVLLGSVVFTLVVSEIALRIFYPGYSPLFLDIYQMDQSGVLMLRPNIERRHLSNEFDVTVKTNAEGLRDRVTPVPDKNGRVLGIGDSMAFGWGVELEQSYYYLAEESLRPNEIQIVKAGIPATGTIDQFKWLRHYGDAYKPRAVVLSFCVFNDFTDNLAGGVSKRFTVRDGLMVWFNEENRSKLSVSALNEKIKRSSLLAQKAAQVWWYFDTKIVNPEDRTNPGLRGQALLENGQIHLKQLTPDAEKAIAVTLTALDEINQWCEERKIPLLLLVIPHSFQVYQWELSKWEQAYHLNDTDLDLV